MNGISLNTSTASLTDPLLSESPLPQDPKQLATEFEGLFVSLLLKQMRQASEMNGEGGGLFPGDSSDTYGGIFDMYLGQHIAGSGGIGLARSIENSLT